MKKRSRLSMIGAGFALALASITGAYQSAQAYVNKTVQHEQKGKDVGVVNHKEARPVHNAGGLDLMQHGVYGMSPKEYGLNFGHGNGKGRTNKLRCSHNAKLKRR